MTTGYRVLTSQDQQDAGSAHQRFALDVLQGLSQPRKRLSSMHFYDERGSELFQRIMDLPEYYLTRAEHQILSRHRGELAETLIDGAFQLVELGSGDGRKTNLLLETMLDEHLDFVYRPIDISEAAVSAQSAALTERFPGLEAQGLVAEYLDGMMWNSRFSTRRNVVLLLGSNIGNFSLPDARAFLRSLWSFLRDDDLALIGFDLKKDIDTMIGAYNDDGGVTSAFNMNLLARINRELDADIDLDAFQHHSTYNVFSGSMESYLVSLARQTVHVGAVIHSFEFAPYEPIHTEYSYKFLMEDIEALARDTGFSIEAQWLDDQGRFADSLWEVRKR